MAYGIRGSKSVKAAPNNPEHQALYAAAYKAGNKMYGHGSGHDHFSFTHLHEAGGNHKIEHIPVASLKSYSANDTNSISDEYSYGFHPKTGKGFEVATDDVVEAHGKHADAEGKMHLYHPESGITVVHGDKL